MVASYYIRRPFYYVAWRLHRLFRSKRKIILYCEDAFDVVLFRNVQKYLAPVPIVVRNRRILKDVQSLGYHATLTPSFPDVVIMFRNAAWRFPCNQIVKIGLEHGAYNFKRFSKPVYYNMFTVFLMTSEADAVRIRAHGVTTAKAVGFPKVDSAFDGSITAEGLQTLANKGASVVSVGAPYR